MTRVCGLVWLVLAGGCTQPSNAPRPLSPSASQPAPALRLARAHAPDLVALAEQAERAMRAAQDAGDQKAAADHAIEARLWMSAAIVESERVALLRERRAWLEREDAAQARVASALAQRSTLEGELKLATAQQEARQEVLRVFVTPMAARSMRRSRRQQSERWRAEATRLLLSRARLAVAAGLALGASARTAAETQQMLARAGAHRSGSRRAYAAAQQALLRAQGLLGNARAARPGPRMEEIASLLEAAHFWGLAAERLPRGIRVPLHDLFRGRSVRPRARGSSRLRRIAELVEAHPHGSIRVGAWRGDSVPPLPRGVAKQRAERLVAQLAKLVSRPDRLKPHVLEGGTPGGGQVVFVAYGARPLTKAPPVPREGPARE